ncbi:hypothetical protein [Aliamphritea spongicola]|nr:hypothetical protein [Aliamphritea spongicola]
MADQNPVFIPGPTNIPDRLRNAMHIQSRDHRAPDFVETFAPVLRDCKKYSVPTVVKSSPSRPVGPVGGKPLSVTPCPRVTKY